MVKFSFKNIIEIDTAAFTTVVRSIEYLVSD